MKILTLFSALFIGNFPIALVNNCSDCQLKNAESNYEVYVRHCDDSPVEEVKLLDKFDGDFAQLVRVMNDIETNKKLTESCAEARLLKTLGKNTSLQYFHYIMPFGVKDRDVVSKVTINATDSTYSYVTQAVDDNTVARKPDIIRVTNARTSWFFRKNSAGAIEMQYTGFADPNGSIPAWIINALTRRESRAIVEKLKKLVRQ